VVFGATYDTAAVRLLTATYTNGLFTVTYTYDQQTGLLAKVTDNLPNAWVAFD
jgi:hypothetical protein